MELRIVLYTEGLPFTPASIETGALGGSESAFIFLARELAMLGHSVLAFCVCPSPGVYDGVEYRHVTEFEKWRQTERCDLFICSRYFQVLFEPLDASVKTFWNHDFYPRDAAPAIAAVTEKIDYIYCLSNFHCEYTRHILAPLSPPILKVPNGVDFNLVNAARAGAAKRHRIMYTSRPERGLPQALEIYERLGDKSLELLICTYPLAGYQAVEEECAAKEEALRERGFAVRSTHLSKSELYRSIAESKAVIYPIQSAESFCIAAIEAQACGTVFLTNGGSALDETVAYRLKTDDVDNFTEVLRKIVADDEYRGALEARGLEHARNYSWENIARQFVEDAKRCWNAPQITVPASTRVKRRGKKPAPPSLARFREIVPDLQARCGLPTVAGAQPKISCLMVTLNRLVLLKEAVRCYCEQTWPNRELVIVTDGSARYKESISRYVCGLARGDIRLVFVSEPANLAELRNISLDAARGDIVCQWDDDDLCHPERLTQQAEALLAGNAQACFLTDQLHFDRLKNVMRWIDWSRDGQLQGTWRLIPGTLMMHKDGAFPYPTEAPFTERGEDSALLESIYGRAPITTLSGAGYLHVYTYHGNNTFPEDHHQAFLPASTAFLEDKLARLVKALESYDLPMPYLLTGRNGEVIAVINR
jgi:glycosyltransferase involved in cell wall biosynthesis